ncbi:MAG: hypothetical protein V3V09_02925 [Arenicellales bacterium]
MTSVFITLIGVGSETLICDSILFEGFAYLVPCWIENPKDGWKTPEIAIRINTDDLQDSSRPDLDKVYKYPIPKDVFYGLNMTQKEYVVLETLELRIAL